MKKSYSIYTTVEEQKDLQAKYCADRIQDAPPRSEWMTVDECFDDVINSVERAYKHEEFDPSKWIPLDEAEERLVAAISKIYDEVHNEDQ
jgi:hypothetical protein